MIEKNNLPEFDLELFDIPHSSLYKDSRNAHQLNTDWYKC